MNRNIILGTLTVGLLLVLTGLVYNEEATSIDSIPDRSISLQLVAETTEANVNQLVTATNRFGFNLFSQIEAQERQNIIISPSSIAIALAMTRNGTGGETLSEMTAVLELDSVESG